MPLQIDDGGGRHPPRARSRRWASRSTPAKNTSRDRLAGSGRVTAWSLRGRRRARHRHGRLLGRHPAARRAGPRSAVWTSASAAASSIDEHCRTSDPDIYAIGECALARGRIYGLVGPGYQMARTAVATLSGGDDRARRRRHDHQAQAHGRRRGELRRRPRPRSPAPARSPSRTRSPASTRSSSSELGPPAPPRRGPGRRRLQLRTASCRSPRARPSSPHRPRSSSSPAIDGATAPRASTRSPARPPSARARTSPRASSATPSAARISARSGRSRPPPRPAPAAASCVPLLGELLTGELKRAGKKVSNHLCEHFPHSRQELFHLVRLHGLRTFDALIAQPRPRHGLRDLQAGGGVDPRLDLERARAGRPHARPPGHQRPLPGQHPARRHLLGRAAGARRRDHARPAHRPGRRSRKKYGLYTKITGGQRVDLFGARAGAASGHLGASSSPPASSRATPTARRCAR